MYLFSILATLSATFDLTQNSRQADEKSLTSIAFCEVKVVVILDMRDELA